MKKTHPLGPVLVLEDLDKLIRKEAARYGLGVIRFQDIQTLTESSWRVCDASRMSTLRVELHREKNKLWRVTVEVSQSGGTLTDHEAHVWARRLHDVAMIGSAVCAEFGGLYRRYILA